MCITRLGACSPAVGSAANEAAWSRDLRAGAIWLTHAISWRRANCAESEWRGGKGGINRMGLMTNPCPLSAVIIGRGVAVPPSSHSLGWVMSQRSTVELLHPSWRVMLFAAPSLPRELSRSSEIFAGLAALQQAEERTNER